jgi:hypothetical protein
MRDVSKVTAVESFVLKYHLEFILLCWFIALEN